MLKCAERFKEHWTGNQLPARLLRLYDLLHLVAPGFCLVLLLLHGDVGVGAESESSVSVGFRRAYDAVKGKDTVS